MQSIFRYPGGKTRSGPRNWILSMRPRGIKEYREPFVGGGGIFFGMHDPGKRWINDMHPGLIAVYEALRDRPDEFIRSCKEIEPEIKGEEQTQPGPRGKATYCKRLALIFDSFKLNTNMDQALRYYFVNRTGWAGRVNYDIPSRLYYSNPSGWNIVKTDRLERAAEHISGTAITCGDYRPLLSEPGEDVWIYCDPPYVCNTAFSESSRLYQHNFEIPDHLEFVAAVLRSPHKVCVSYDHDAATWAEEVYKFSGCRMEYHEWAYCGSSDSQKKIGKELLVFHNY